MKGILLMVPLVSFLIACGVPDRTPAKGNSSLIPPLKLQSLGIPLSAYVVTSLDPERQFPLEIDSVTNHFQGEIEVPTNQSFDLTVVYTLLDPVSGRDIQIARYLRRGLTANGTTMRVVYAGDESHWEIFFDLSPGSPNDLNLDGDPYNNFIEIGYGSDPTSAADLPLGPKTIATHKDPLLNSDVSLPPPGADTTSSLKGEVEITLEALTIFDVVRMEVVSPSGIEILSSDEEMKSEKKIRIKVDTLQFVTGSGSMDLTVRVTDEYNLTRETTLTFAVYNPAVSTPQSSLLPPPSSSSSPPPPPPPPSPAPEPTPPPPPPPSPVCGNEVLEEVEECDDGNLDINDGCNEVCRLEPPVIDMDTPAEGEIIRDIAGVLATATSEGGVSLAYFGITDHPEIEQQIIQNNQILTLTGRWDVRNMPEDTNASIRFEARDIARRTSVVTRTVRIDNVPNISFFLVDGQPEVLIQSGGQAILTWDADNFTTLSIDNGVVIPEGALSVSVTPTETTTYTFTAERTNGLGGNPPSYPFRSLAEVRVRVNHPPQFDEHTTQVLGQFPDNATLSWDRSDPDGDTVTSTVDFYRGTDCTGETLETQSTTGSSVNPTGLDPRTDYSYTVVLDDENGGMAESDCSNLTTTDTGLVGWWRFNEIEGVYTLDSSGNEHPGTLEPQAAPPSLMVDGGRTSLEFDGIDDYIYIDDHADFYTPSGLTLEAWIKPETVAVNQFIIGQYLDGTPLSDASFRLMLFGDNPETGIFETGSNWITTDPGGSPVSAGVWAHLVGVWDGGETEDSLRLYLNGRLVAAGGTEIGDFTGIRDSSEPLRIGVGSNNPDGLRDFFKGLVDEVAVYNKALSVDDIRRNCRRNDPSNVCPDSREPIILTPFPNQVLPPTLAYWSWRGERGEDAVERLTYSLSFRVDQGGGWLGPTPRTITAPGYFVEDPLFSNSDYEVIVTATDPLGEQFSTMTPFSTDASLSAWWPFEGNANDAVGVNHGTAVGGGRYTGGIAGQAIDLDGVVDYVYIAVPDPDPLNPGYYLPLDFYDASREDFLADTVGTVSAWFNARSVGGTVAGAFAGAGAFAPSPDLYSHNEWNSIGPGWIDNVNSLYAGGSRLTASGDAPVTEGAWHMVTYTQSATEHRLYIDGVLQELTYVNGDPAMNLWFAPRDEANGKTLRAFLIGARSANREIGSYFDGLIDEVAIFNRNLASADACNSYLASCFLSDLGPSGGCDTSCVGD